MGEMPRRVLTELLERADHPADPEVRVLRRGMADAGHAAKGMRRRRNGRKRWRRRRRRRRMETGRLF